jgi:Sulfotransferase family
LTDVLYLLGKGRSGSTLLSMALGELDGVFAAGELRFFWRRGLVEDRRCACGQRITGCAVWGAVAERVADLDAEAVARDSEAVFRWGAAPRLLRGRTTGWAPFQRWSAATSRLIDAVAAVTGAEVIVDSSKWPTDPGVLGRVDAIAPYSLLLVRDPRAVAWSWQRTKAHHDLEQPREMDRFPAWHSGLSWTTRNVVAGLAARRSPGPRMTLRYEDFTADPVAGLTAIGRFLGRDVDGTEVLDGRTLRGTEGHTLAGNPTRFGGGEVTIRPDDEWHTGLSPRDRRTVSALTWPLRRRYGY